MPFPADDALDATIESLYDAVLDRAAQPGQFGIITGQSARLQAASQRRLVLAIEKATTAQERMAVAQEQTNRHIVKLERVGIAIAIVGAVLAAVQVGIAIWAR
jgi:hypothetical protein